MSLNSRFTSQPDSRNSAANQSSSSGWVGGCPCDESSLVLTMRYRKSLAESVHSTRAISGLEGSKYLCW